LAAIDAAIDKNSEDVHSVSGQQVGQGRIERSVPAQHSAFETFDVGVDAGLPVALNYYDRAPFKFRGR